MKLSYWYHFTFFNPLMCLNVCFCLCTLMNTLWHCFWSLLYNNYCNVIGILLKLLLKEEQQNITVTTVMASLTRMERKEMHS